MKFIIQRSKEVVESLDSLERNIAERLESDMQEKVFQKVIDSTPGELSLLANAVIIENISPEEVELQYLEENGLILGVSGTMYVSQEYGKGDDFCSMHTNYPFKVPVEACVNDPTNMTVKIDELEVDTASWYK